MDEEGSYHSAEGDRQVRFNIESEGNAITLTVVLVSLLIFVVIAYILIYMNGRRRNQQLVEKWWRVHRRTLESAFTLADNGPTASISNPNLYSLNCTGTSMRVDLYVEIDMVSREHWTWPLMLFLNPQSDKVRLRLSVPQNAMEPFVFAVGKKIPLLRMHKKYEDLDKYTELAKRYDPGLSQYIVLSEIPEATAAVMMDMGVAATLKNFMGIIEYIYITDQFAGARDLAGEPASNNNPGVIILCYNLPEYNSCRCSDTMRRLYVVLTELMYHLVDFEMSEGSHLRSAKNRGTLCPTQEEQARGTGTQGCRRRRRSLSAE